jgi:LCP family protein required for cell wall assembly
VPPEDEQQSEKPYRVYRGGRAKGRVPLERRPQEASAQAGSTVGDGGGRYPGPGPVRQPGRRRFRPNLRSSTFWLRFAGFCFLFVFCFAILWSVLAYFAVRGGAQEANKRLPKGTKRTLVDQNGLLFFHGTTILYMGLDHSRQSSRSGERHSDTILLIRTDPGRHRLAYLSIPRDLRVEVPGYGFQKINAAYQIGGPSLAIQTVRSYTGLPVNHLLIADFNDFRTVIDELGGIDVYVPEKILSNPFDCPYSSVERCHQWKGWRYAKGWQHMNGWRALIYSRIRENQLDPSESDLTRGERQQAVLQATLHGMTTFHTFLRLPFMGGDVFRPLATDLSAGQLLQLGWNFKRANANRSLHCRLGGTGYDDPSLGSVIQPTEENFGVIHMFEGDSAPQPPLPGSGPYGPGCVVGSSKFRR